MGGLLDENPEMNLWKVQWKGRLSILRGQYQWECSWDWICISELFRSKGRNGTNAYYYYYPLVPCILLHTCPCRLHPLMTNLSSSLAPFSLSRSQEINYDSARGGVSVITEKGELTTSYLLVQRARVSDSGKYTCAPSNANPSTVSVHILSGTYHPCRFSLDVVHGG